MTAHDQQPETEHRNETVWKFTKHLYNIYNIFAAFIRNCNANIKQKDFMQSE